MIRKSMIIIGIVFFCVITFNNTVDTHPGRTDKYGGHRDNINGGYHFHTPKNKVGAGNKNPILKGDEGNERYIPTKLEWLEVYLNSRFKNNWLGVPGINLSLSYRAIGNNTIEVDVSYTKTAPQSALTYWSNKGKESVNTVAEYYGWQNWVKTKVKYELLEK